MDLVVAAKTYSALFGTKRPRSGSRPPDPLGEDQGHLQKVDQDLAHPAEVPIYVSSDCQTDFSDTSSLNFTSSLSHRDPPEFHPNVDFFQDAGENSNYEVRDLQARCEHGFSSAIGRDISVDTMPEVFAEERFEEVKLEKLFLTSGERKRRSRRKSADSLFNRQQRFHIVCKACGERMTVTVRGLRVQVESSQNLFHSFDDTLHHTSSLYPSYFQRPWSSPGQTITGVSTRSYSNKSSPSFLTPSESFANSVFSSPGYLSPNVDYLQNRSFTSNSTGYNTPELQLEEAQVDAEGSFVDAVGVKPTDDGVTHSEKEIFDKDFLKLKLNEEERLGDVLEDLAARNSVTSNENKENKPLNKENIETTETLAADEIELVGNDTGNEEIITPQDRFRVSELYSDVDNIFETVQRTEDFEVVSPDIPAYSSARENFDEGNIALAAHWEKVKDKILAQKEAFESFDCLDRFSGIVTVEKGETELMDVNDISLEITERDGTMSSADSALGSCLSDREEGKLEVIGQECVKEKQELPQESTAVFNPFETIEEYSETENQKGEKNTDGNDGLLNKSINVEDDNMSDDTIVNDLIDLNDLLNENSQSSEERVTSGSVDFIPSLTYTKPTDISTGEYPEMIAEAWDITEETFPTCTEASEEEEGHYSFDMDEKEQKVKECDSKKSDRSDLSETDIIEETDLKISQHEMYIPNTRETKKVDTTLELVEVNEPLIIKEVAKKKVAVVEHVVNGYNEVRVPMKPADKTYKSEAGVFVEQPSADEGDRWLENKTKKDSGFQYKIQTKDDMVQCNLVETSFELQRIEQNMDDPFDGKQPGDEYKYGAVQTKDAGVQHDKIEHESEVMPQFSPAVIKVLTKDQDSQYEDTNDLLNGGVPSRLFSKEQSLALQDTNHTSVSHDGEAFPFEKIAEETVESRVIDMNLVPVQSELKTIDQCIQCQIWTSEPEDAVQSDKAVQMETKDQIVQCGGGMCTYEFETQTELEYIHQAVQCEIIHGEKVLETEDEIEYELTKENKGVQSESNVEICDKREIGVEVHVPTVDVASQGKILFKGLQKCL